MKRLVLLVVPLALGLLSAPAYADPAGPGSSPPPYYQVSIITSGGCERALDESEGSQPELQPSPATPCPEDSASALEASQRASACICSSPTQTEAVQNDSAENTLPGFVEGNEPVPSTTEPSADARKAAVVASNLMHAPTPSPSPIASPTPPHASSKHALTATTDDVSRVVHHYTHTRYSSPVYNVASVTVSRGSAESLGKTDLVGSQSTMPNGDGTPLIVWVAGVFMLLALVSTVLFIIIGRRATRIRKADMNEAIREKAEKSAKMAQLAHTTEPAGHTRGRHRRGPDPVNASIG